MNKKEDRKKDTGFKQEIILQFIDYNCLELIQIIQPFITSK